MSLPTLIPSNQTDKTHDERRTNKIRFSLSNSSSRTFTQERFSRSDRRLVSCTDENTALVPVSTSSKITEIANSQVTDIVEKCRKGELEKMRKRKTVFSFSKNICSREEGPLKKILKFSLEDKSDLPTIFYDPFKDIFSSSSCPQLIASVTGSIVAYNDEFQKKWCANSYQKCLNYTIFNLVHEGSLCKIFELCSMALDDFSLDEVANASNETDLVCTLSSESLSSRTDKYLSARLPCKQPFSDYTITITLMNDVDKAKRCFYCVFNSPQSMKSLPNRVGGISIVSLSDLLPLL